MENPVITSFSNLITYMDALDDGKWVQEENPEHHSTAVPKVTEHLRARLDKIVTDLSANIRARFEDKPKTERILEEIAVHQTQLKSFKERVFEKVDFEAKVTEEKLVTQQMALEKMGNVNLLAKSPPGFKKTSQKLSRYQLHLGNTEILKVLKESEKRLQQLKEVIEKTQDCWETIMSFDTEEDPQKILVGMSRINENIRLMNKDERGKKIAEAILWGDDAIQGFLNVDYFPIEGSFLLSEKLIRFIQKTVIKYFHNFKDGAILVNKAFEGLKQLDEMRSSTDIYVAALKNAIKIIDIVPSEKADSQKCYAQLGELHSNIALKRHELQELLEIKDQLPPEVLQVLDKVLLLLHSIHERFVQVHGNEPCRSTEMQIELQDRNIRELELMARGCESLLKETSSGSEVFLTVNSHLRKLYRLIGAKYQILNTQNLKNCIDILGTDLFQEAINSCKELMIAVFKEKKGTSTSHKAIHGTILGLNNFMTNTLHALIREMLHNTTYDQSDARGKLEKAFRNAERALRELNQ